MSRLQPDDREQRYLGRLGASIAAAREAAGMTQRDLAARCGTSRSQVCRAEAGTASVEVVSLVRIARALGVQVADLLP